MVRRSLSVRGGCVAFVSCIGSCTAMTSTSTEITRGSAPAGNEPEIVLQHRHQSDSEQRLLPVPFLFQEDIDEAVAVLHRLGAS